jgi:hypothetical protein
LQIVSHARVDLDVEAASVQSQTRRNPYERRKSIDEAIYRSVLVGGGYIWYSNFMARTIICIPMRGDVR